MESPFTHEIIKLKCFLQILHHSVDYLVGQAKEKHFAKYSHKLGFSNPEEYEEAIKVISKIYHQYVMETITELDLLSHFAHFNSDFQRSVLDVLKIRRNQIENFLIDEHNSQSGDLMTSFDWDIRMVIGTSNMLSHRTEILTLILNCKTSKSKDLKTIHMEIDKEKLDRLIEMLEECDRKMST